MTWIQGECYPSPPFLALLLLLLLSRFSCVRLCVTPQTAAHQDPPSLEFSCFFYDPMDVGNLISDTSAFSKSSWYIWNFLVHILLKPNLKDFEHLLTAAKALQSCPTL